MTKPDYTAFDAELLAQIKAGRNCAGLLLDVRELRKLAQPFCVASKSPFGTGPWRITGRRLQALRKAGKIRYSGAKWEVI